MPAQKNIIHLDDHTLFQKGFQSILKKQNDDFFVYQFQHPKDAIEYINTCLELNVKIDLVITDYNHPGLNGYEFAKKIRTLEMEHGTYIPILLFTMVTIDNLKIQTALSETIFNQAISKATEAPEVIEVIEDLCLD